MSKRKTAPIENRLSDWRIMRRKGRMVRYQNMVTAEWDGWQMDPEPPAFRVQMVGAKQFGKTAMIINSAYGRGKPLMGFDPAMSGLLLDQMTLTTLKALADAQGVSYTSRTRKPALIELLMPEPRVKNLHMNAVSAFPSDV